MIAASQVLDTDCSLIAAILKSTFIMLSVCTLLSNKQCYTNMSLKFLILTVVSFSISVKCMIAHYLKCVLRIDLANSSHDHLMRVELINKSSLLKIGIKRLFNYEVRYDQTLILFMACTAVCKHGPLGLTLMYNCGALPAPQGFWEFGETLNLS